VLAALRLDTGRLPVPRADGDREALRILLVARQEITVARTAQAGRLRALLLAGDDTDRRAARTTLPGKALAALAGRDLPAHASREQAVRQAEIARLAQDWTRPDGSSRTTTPSCWPSSMTLLPG
jgi:transposase